ncbi:MAG: hypothetical protein ABWY83_07555, partial [Actinomycetota bacterium]
ACSDVADRDAGARGPGSFPSIPVSRPPAEVDPSVLDRDLQVDAPQPAIAVCDREYLRRILDNLIDNAFKYGRPPVRIKVTGAPATSGSPSSTPVEGWQRRIA